MPSLSFQIESEPLDLLPQRALYFSRLQTLVLSDLHFGKINHFRKAGIAVPVAANNANTELLVKLLMVHKPKRTIFIGDLFHSSYNAEWEVLGQVIQNFSSCSFELVPGNHDILSNVQYERHKILLHKNIYPLTETISLVHEPPEEKKENIYYISGHIHPAVMLTGKARQSLTLPCFWFGLNQAFLPAFGVFTGFKAVKPIAGDKIFAILKDDVMDVSSAAS